MKSNYSYKKEDAFFAQNIFLTGKQIKTLRKHGTLQTEAEA